LTPFEPQIYLLDLVGCHGRAPVGRQKARYYCSTWRVGFGCDQLTIIADKVERQVVEFVSDFNR
jgi:hypothetical protein